MPGNDDSSASRPLRAVHAYLFPDDVEMLQKIAAERRTKWQTELRHLVHRALKGELREVIMIRDGSGGAP